MSGKRRSPAAVAAERYRDQERSSPAAPAATAATATGQEGVWVPQHSIGRPPPLVTVPPPTPPTPPKLQGLYINNKVAPAGCSSRGGSPQKAATGHDGGVANGRVFHGNGSGKMVSSPVQSCQPCQDGTPRGQNRDEGVTSPTQAGLGVL